MKYISNKEYKLLSKEEQNTYLISYINELFSLSLRTQHSSDNYALPSWPYMQAGQVESQKVLNKILDLIKK